MHYSAHGKWFSGNAILIQYIFWYCVWSSPCLGCVVYTAAHWMWEPIDWPRLQPCGGRVQAHWWCRAAPDPSYKSKIKNPEKMINTVTHFFFFTSYYFWLWLQKQTSHVLIRPASWLWRDKISITVIKVPQRKFMLHMLAVRYIKKLSKCCCTFSLNLSPPFKLLGTVYTWYYVQFKNRLGREINCSKCCIHHLQSLQCRAAGWYISTLTKCICCKHSKLANNLWIQSN